MTAPRLNARRRRKARRVRDALRAACLTVEETTEPDRRQDNPRMPSESDSNVEKTGSSAEKPPTEPPSTTKSNERPPEPKTPAPPPKPRRCRHRRLPDRHYYKRAENLDYRYLAFQRRIQHLVDVKLAEGANEIASWKRELDTKHYKAQKCVDNQANLIKREYKNVERRVRSLERRVK